MFGHFFDAFIILFVVIDPISLAPIFAAMTHGETAINRRRLAVRGALIAMVILFVFAVAGDSLLHVLGITMPAFQIAGGVLLFLLAVEMVFARPSGIRYTTEREQKEAQNKKDISVFPLAFPLVAGPGALTTVLLMVGEKGHDIETILVVLTVVGVILLITLVSLLLAVRITKMLGQTGANVVSRLLGVILAALAAQYILDGIHRGL